MVIHPPAFVEGKDNGAIGPRWAIHHGIDQLSGFGYAVLYVARYAVGFLIRIRFLDEGDRSQVTALRIRYKL